MLHNVKTLANYTLRSLDGDMGKVKEFYFDDQYWAIRYLVADTGNWLIGRKVLISPYALTLVNKEEKHIAISLTKQQIEDSPSISSDKPVSRQFEETVYGYYGWPMYWGGTFRWGMSPYIQREQAGFDEKPNTGEKASDSHLRSTHNVSGYHFQATDGEIGHVDDFIIDNETWAIRYLVVDTRNWWPGKKVIISPNWIERVSWNDSMVFVNHTRENIKNSPEFKEESLLARDYEAELHLHYGRKGYWEDEATAKKQSADK